MNIVVDNLSKNFKNFKILDNVNLAIKGGSLFALVGPSGSGKSTLLKIIGGLEVPDSGTIWLGGKNLTYLPIQERNIGFVSQNYSLFNNMTIFQNVAFGLDIRSINYTTISKRVKSLLHLIQLEKFSNQYPNQLSGGQKQRVALARALAINPKVLLLDEPFGAVDSKVRREIRNWLRNFHEQVSLTTVFVTHDQQEALEIADKITIFQNGQIKQTGRPKDIYEHPENLLLKQNVLRNKKYYFKN